MAIMVKSATAAASRMGKSEVVRDAGGRRRKRRDWLWNLGTLRAVSLGSAF